MDYSLAALKLFCCHLNDVQPSSSSSSSSSSSAAAMTLFGILFQRAWLQGVLLSGHGDGRFLLDDGSGVVELSLSPESQPQEWKKGMYVMVVGPFTALQSANALPLIKVHKIVDLSPYPDREAMWHLEVIEACKLFYLRSLE
ncbi:hypothetical protein ACMD2_06364 [Ananas comosus]|uniref:RecQ-mediated genome instability protein 2 n=1 Tax=Ananas comosus TaxID=4615 RepID=A0A199UN74_ANACO|nr:hypothetical protein ACMD2_06364 [Ananas comosus]